MPAHESFPPDPGTYILFLLLSKSETILVGSLGSWDFPRGYYAYTGSAQGPGGLAGRLRRHLRPRHQKRTHWHIDSLSTTAQIVRVWWEKGSENHECSWAQYLAERGSIPVPGFGSSDCRCPGHLVLFPTLMDQPHKWQNMMVGLGNNLETALIDAQ